MEADKAVSMKAEELILGALGLPDAPFSE